MKKKPLIIGLVVVAVVVGLIVGMGSKKDNNTNNSQTGSSASTSASKGKYTAVDACTILTAPIAQQLAGSDASTSTTPSPAAQSGAINVSDCSYYSISTKMSVGLLARSPLNKEGADDNHLEFTSGLPSDAQKVSGYGDSAFWSPSYGQFNILAHDTWYILTYGPVKPTDHTLAQAKQFADQIKDKL